MHKVQIADNEPFDIEFEGDELTINGKKEEIDLELVSTNKYLAFHDNKAHKIEITGLDRAQKSVKLKINGKLTEVSIKNNLDLLLDKLGMSQVASSAMSDLNAPMPGMILKIQVEEGQEVKKGDPLLILEAMKMENVIKAQGEGTVKSILVKEGQSVEKNQVMLNF
ncbi:MAG: biotin/lipoyl-containing protein [Cyclobacteriaceae bacterium]